MRPIVIHDPSLALNEFVALSRLTTSSKSCRPVHTLGQASPTVNPALLALASGPLPVSPPSSNFGIFFLHLEVSFVSCSTPFTLCRCYVTPLLGAYIADTYWGRFNTICVAVGVALVGHAILIVSAVPGVIEHKSAVGAFSVALIVMGLGASSFTFPSFARICCSVTFLFRRHLLSPPC